MQKQLEKFKESRFNFMKCVFILFIMIITIVRVWLAYETPLYFLPNAAYDDGLFVEHANSFILGEWLGNFECRTIAKIPGFSIYLACCYWLGVPYSLGLIFTFILSVGVTILALSPIIKNKFLLVLLYILLLYNPLMFDIQIAQRVYRGGVLVCFSLMTISSFIGLYVRRFAGFKNVLVWTLLCCFSFTCFYIMKEDSVWLLPFCIGVILCFIVSLVKNAKFKVQYVFPILLPFLSVVIAMNIISYANQNNYNIHATADRVDSNFRLVVEDLNMIEDSNYDDNQWLWVSHEALNKAFDCSPTLANLKQAFDENYEVNDHDSMEDYKGDIIFWRIKNLVNEAGIYSKGGSEVEAFYLQIHQELQNAFDSGKLNHKEGLSVSKLTPPLSSSELEYVAFSTIVNLEECFFYNSAISSSMMAGGTEEQLELFSSITNSKYVKTDYQGLQFQPLIDFNNSICSFYKLISKVLFLLAIVGVALYIIFKINGVRNGDKSNHLNEELTIVLIVVGLALTLIGQVFGVSLYMRFLDSDIRGLLYTGCVAIYTPIIEVMCVHLGVSECRKNCKRLTKRPSSDLASLQTQG